ncbi:unnamed protein product [Schistocephalus solidus]|uniref:Secreted protein n=1 Tax=Schistocephalus solidus TaxID=70667 RepID=A0A183SUV9_SCHSO|nr:unnamed protein product [Schistocephalus solidus]
MLQFCLSCGLSDGGIDGLSTPSVDELLFLLNWLMTINPVDCLHTSAAFIHCRFVFCLAHFMKIAVGGSGAPENVRCLFHLAPCSFGFWSYFANMLQFLHTSLSILITAFLFRIFHNPTSVTSVPINMGSATDGCSK